MVVGKFWVFSWVDVYEVSQELEIGFSSKLAWSRPRIYNKEFVSHA